MKAETPKIIVRIKPGEPTLAQQAAWAKLWARLLSECQKQADNEAGEVDKEEDTRCG